MSSADRRVAVALGITPPSDEREQALRGSLRADRTQDYRPLTFAAGRVDALREALRSLDYEILPPEGGHPTESGEVVQLVDEALREDGRRAVVVHLLGHGYRAPKTALDPTRHLHLVGADRKPLDEPVDAWIRRTWEPERTSDVLFVVDCCHSGLVARLRGERRLSRRRHWVLAACGPDDEAYQGWLTRALTAVLQDLAAGRIDVAPTVEFVDLGRVFREVQEKVDLLSQEEGYGRTQRIVTTGLDRHPWGHGLPFFRNPHYQPPVGENLLAGVPDEVAQLLTSVIDPDHFLDRITADWLNPAERRQPIFCGRDTHRSWLRRWARGDGPALQVVTGKPGVGKSALLGAVVYATHPKLRHVARPQLVSNGVMPAPIDNLGVVHARKRVLDQVTQALVFQWGLDQVPSRQPWSPDRLVAAVRRLPDPPTLVLDALEEAERPEDLLAALVLPLATAVRADGSPACRMLVAMRSDERLPDERLRVLQDVAERQGGLDALHSLDATTPDELLDLREELEHYVSVLLERSRWPLTGDVLGTLVEEIAATLTPQDGRPLDCGEFLVAGLYVRHLLRHPEPPGTADQARAFVRGLPVDVPGILALDLDVGDRPGREWVRPVTAALAFAEGNGMPRPIVRVVAGAFSPAFSRFAPASRTASPAAAPHGGLPRPRPGDGPTIDQVKQALDDLRHYLRYDVDEDDATVLYRLFHNDLARALRRDPFGGPPVGGPPVGGPPVGGGRGV